MGDDFHGNPLLASWFALANIAVIIIALRWSKYSFYLHLLLALVIVGLTLAGTLSFIQSWLPKASFIKATDKPNRKLQKLHNWVGFILVCSLGFQIITGFISRFIKRSQKIHPSIVIWSRRTHMILSYMIMLMAKFNYLLIHIKQEQIGSFIVLLIIDILCIVIYLILKAKYYTFSEVITNYAQISSQNNQQGFGTKIIRIIKQIFKPKSALQYSKQQLSVKKLYSQDQIKLQKYVIFNDYVYDTKPLENVHPGGQYLIKHTNKRQIDRFIYGASPFQLLPDVKVNNHTKDSLNICGQPIAKIQRISPMINLNQLSKVTIIKCKKLAQKGSTHFLHLKIGNKVNAQNQGVTSRQFLPQYKGYTNTQQFGQYFTLSLIGRNGKVRCTRLYTTIWCMRPQNIQFMQNTFPAFLQTKNVNNSKSIQSTQNQMYSSNNKTEIIPLVIKKYEKGQFTSQLFAKNNFVECIISRPMGKGLYFDKLKSSGKVIFLSGGTGILPFCDFIDILFKRAKYLEGINIASNLADEDPLIKDNFVEKKDFIIYHSAEYADDIPSLTLFQISQLCKSIHINFKAILRVSKDAQNIPESYKKTIEITKDYFNQRIKKQHLGAGYENQICKIYICGSKQLNYQMGKLLVDEKIPENLYHFM